MGKLTIPVPKCQQTRRPTTAGIKLAPDEIDKYCDWVAADKISRGATITEVSLLVNNTDNTCYTANAAAGYTSRAIPDLVTY